MARLRLTVFAETDGELCANNCPMMYSEGDDCHGYGEACAAFGGDELKRERQDPNPNSPPGRNWVVTRYRRLAACIDAEQAQPDPKPDW